MRTSTCVFTHDMRSPIHSYNIIRTGREEGIKNEKKGNVCKKREEKKPQCVADNGVAAAAAVGGQRKQRERKRERMRESEGVREGWERGVGERTRERERDGRTDGR